MQNCINVFCEKLAQLECDDDVLDKLYDLTELIENQTDVSPAYEAIFEFMENNPVSDIGSPGPLVHLLEQHYPNYVPALISSIRNAPALSTILMLHRILNSGIAEPERNHYLNLLQSVSQREDVAKQVSEEAVMWFQFHKCQPDS